MNRGMTTKVIKAREVEISFSINETDRDDALNLDRLRKEGSRDFQGSTIDLKLTDNITVHSVIAIEDIKFVPVKPERGGFYLTGESNPRSATVTVKLILDAARVAQLHPENLIGNADDDVLELPSSDVKALR